ncbi:MAG: hypothetical protein ACLQMF_19150 [Rectinemataceae bacterium]
MTAQRLEHCMILTVSRAAQLVYTEDTAAAYALLSDADRLFRYLAAPDQSVLLSDELGALRILLRLDPSLDVHMDPAPGAESDSRFGDRSAEGRSFCGRSVGDEALWPCVFVRRLSVIDAILNLAESGEGTVTVAFPPAASAEAVVLVRDGFSVGVGCA